MKLNKILIESLIFIIYWTTLILNSHAQKTEIIDCSNEELVTSIFNDPIDLTLRGIIKIYENVSINEILNTSNNEFDLNYIDARLEDAPTNDSKNLVLFTTENFEDYAKDQTASRISLKINLGCGMGKERVVIFFQPLKEGNYYSPIFPLASYELIIPTPIFAGFDLSAFLEITARDDDLTHNQITFTSNDSLRHFIRVGTKNVTSADKKTYFANLTLEKILMELPQPLQFEIKATDSGSPPRSSKANVIILSDPYRSLPPKPKFAQNLYKKFINFDFEMDPIHIELINGTYSREVEFSLSSSNPKGFILIDNKNGSVDIIWNSENMTKSEILNSKTWELEVKVEHQNLAEVGKTNIFVEMADLKTYFRFMSSYYEGEIDEIGELHITPIIFNPYTYKPDIEFKLESSHDIFQISPQNYSIHLQLGNNFTWQALPDDLSYIKLNLIASWESLYDMTNIVIKLPQIKNETSAPQLFQFEKPLYVGQLNETTYDLKLELLHLETDVANIEEIEYKLSGNDSEWFKLETNENRLEIGLIFKNNFQEFKLKNSYLMILEARLNDRHTYATVVINGLNHNEDLKRKLFVTPLIKGEILLRNSTQELSLEPVRIFDDLEDRLNDLSFLLRGEVSSNFDVLKNFSNHGIDIVLKNPLPSNILETMQLLNFSLEAVLTGLDSFNDTLMVFIELPMKECPSLDIPESDPPQFPNTNFVFTAYTNQTGVLGIVRAFIKSRNATLHYILNTQNELLAQRLSINPFTGELLLYGFLEEGSYNFNISVENIETQENAEVKALLKVQKNQECKLGEGVAVDKTLMIRYIDEESPYYGLMDLKFNENCTFRIVDMWPNDKEYVHINYIFNMLDAIAIDREDEIFQNMSEPQVVVKLRLNCQMDLEQQNLTIDIPEPELRSSKIILSEDISYAPDIMWLYIKINDINDNAPEFKFQGPLYLGYPSHNTVLDMYPEFLIQVEAFDRDIGYNAQIKFSLKENPYFDIELLSGKIYPKGSVLSKDEQTELIIQATDQNGEGLISRNVIIVKALTPEFYSLITLKENSTRTKQELERELSLATGFHINVIKMSYVPQVHKQRLAGNQTLNCKAWIYAYHRHQLVSYQNMEENILIKTPEANIVNVESYEKAALSSQTTSDNSNLGYLIATILLSLISCFSLVFIIWRFYYRPLMSPNCVTKPSSSKGNGQTQISAECSHESDNAKDCLECNQHNDNHVKFSDLVENVIVDETHGK